ncbi:MAG: DUF2283 domain-containing protein [Caldilineales bacterium]|nr:DUF2283 domain-containing protein [Caldilineales bacterium]
MQIAHDPEVDAIYIRLREGDVDDTIETSKYIFVDFVDIDSDGIPLGIKVLFAGKLLKKEGITSVTVNIGSPVMA